MAGRIPLADASRRLGVDDALVGPRRRSESRIRRRTDCSSWACSLVSATTVAGLCPTHRRSASRHERPRPSVACVTGGATPVEHLLATWRAAAADRGLAARLA